MPPAKTIDIAVVGLSCVDCVANGAEPSPGVQNPVSEAHFAAGGIGNAVTALSGMGLRIGVSTRIGADLYGEFLLKRWRIYGVDMAGVRTNPDGATGFSFLVSHNDERTPFYSAGANGDFGLNDIPDAYITGSRCMLVFFAGALPSLDGAPMRELVRRAREAQTAVILDVSDSLSADYSSLPSYLPYANLVLNAEEGMRITGKTAPRDMLSSLMEIADVDSGSPLITAVTCRGSAYLTGFRAGKREFMDVPSPFVNRHVNNVVGAGDAFRAGLAAYICRHTQDYWSGRLDRREACLTAHAFSYAYLSRKSDIKPFDEDFIRGLMEQSDDCD